MSPEILTEKSIQRRRYWIAEIAKVSGKFGDDTSKIDQALIAEIKRDGQAALLDHLRMCGSIPERYGHDSSEEKLYSKYTDALLSIALRQLGLTSVVLSERGDAADVEAVGQHFSLVADAKAFRLSRTAKNQKDFKIEALHGWKRGKPHAMIVCPLYQLPARTSQIYQQAIARNVCVFSYSHLAVLVEFSGTVGDRGAQDILLKILTCCEQLNPTKDSVCYWACVNAAMLNSDSLIGPLWQREKLATLESIAAAKEEALTMLAREREQIMRMSREEAIESLILVRNIDGREKKVRSITDNGILAIS